MRKRYHLCVGINDYPGSNADLRGCVNDALDWEKSLVARGSEGKVLLDPMATKAAVVEGLRELVGKAKMGDRIVFTYSGHGTWIPDRDGDEIDARDEALVCYDYRTGGLLTDDELYQIFSSRRRGVRATIISDSCHSGTMSDARGVKAIRQIANVGSAARFLSPGLLPTVDVTVEQAIIAERTTDPNKSRPGTVLVSGCTDEEVSYDAYIGGRFRGAMTAAALEALAEGNLGLKAFKKALQSKLPSAQFPQTPQVAASRSQERLSLL